MSSRRSGCPRGPSLPTGCIPQGLVLGPPGLRTELHGVGGWAGLSERPQTQRRKTTEASCVPGLEAGVPNPGAALSVCRGRCVLPLQANAPGWGCTRLGLCLTCPSPACLCLHAATVRSARGPPFPCTTAPALGTSTPNDLISESGHIVSHAEGVLRTFTYLFGGGTEFKSERAILRVKAIAVIKGLIPGLGHRWGPPGGSGIQTMGLARQQAVWLYLLVVAVPARVGPAASARLRPRPGTRTLLLVGQLPRCHSGGGPARGRLSRDSWAPALGAGGFRSPISAGAAG